ncbi:hypothetical protein DPMN_068563 [Dreissena polymorpha]|uniref:Uncharacterized protein n=1 Tax=Dreissena polymorpha TaxID=45954 RepID=A0A9D3YXD1_DREPO|nr:hypothetical protein DPMN_068563 [Dreissena polymorpha]
MGESTRHEWVNEGHCFEIVTKTGPATSVGQALYKSDGHRFVPQPAQMIKPSTNLAVTGLSPSLVTYLQSTHTCRRLDKEGLYIIFETHTLLKLF